MKSTALVHISKTLESHSSTLSDIFQAIQDTSNLNHLTEARARIEALRAWAKVHKEIKSLRVELLTVEIAALVRIIELGGEDRLAAKDRKAAKWFSAMGTDERSLFIRKFESTTTAEGLYRRAMQERHNEIEQHRLRNEGIDLATSPPEETYDEDAIKSARGRAHDLSAVLADIAEKYLEDGISFTIEEMADQIITDSGVDEEFAQDDAFIEGVREVCRHVIRSSPPLSVNGLPIPRMITTRINGRYQRIPTSNALMCHLDNMIEDRAEQIKHDQAALNKLIRVASALRKVEQGSGATIGELITELALSNKRATA